MIRSDFHIHSNYCHGKGRLESYVLKAIEKKMVVMGFTSHAPMPLETDWHMKAEFLDDYLDEIKFLKEKYKNEIDIYSGLEVDYVPGITGPEKFKNRGLDFIVGSVHYAGRFVDGTPCGIDNTVEEFERGLKLIFDNDIRRLVSHYYETLISMIENDPPDIVGHLDIIKKLNVDGRYFSEEADWYHDLISKVISALSRSQCVVEVNTRGYYKGVMNEFAPGNQILKKCFEAGIPVTISSDAHRPDEIARDFERAVGTLSNIGYKHISVIEGQDWRQESI